MSSLDPSQKLEVFRRATDLLASSRTFDETMSHTIAAFLPALGDFGFFDLDVGGRVQRTARAFEDPRVEAILKPTQWVRQEHPDLNLCALSTGRSALHPAIDDTWYRTIALNEGHLQVLRDLQFTSMITVPMRYQGELLGALTLFFGRSGRRFDGELLAFAGDLAALAAPVVANARLLERQRATTEALRVSEERMRVGMDAGQLGVWDWDVRTGRVSWSDRVYDLHGLSREEFGGRIEDFWALVQPEDRERVKAAIDAALRGDGTYQLELRTHLRDGVQRWIHTRGEVLRDETGVPVRMLGAVYDITERKRLLAQAEEQNRGKDEFLAMLGHELRNPLTPIVTALHLMERREPSAVRYEREVIQRQVGHMSRLVDDLLEVARLTHGKVKLDPRRVDLGDLVEKVVEEQRPTLAVQLAFTRGEDTFIDGDPVRLAQITSNLLANAAKFSAPGQRVEVRVAAAGDEVELLVRDEGRGIEPDLLPRVFDHFVQGQQELARPRGGLGLGLAIVKNLVGLHGGAVSAYSDGPWRGTTLRVTFPSAGARAVQAQTAAAVRSAPPRAARVLVVDDNADTAETLGHLLRASGHEVRLAGDGPAALAAASGFAPDVAILDIGLPTMDGYELARELRRREPQGLRLIALTGYGTASDRERAVNAGFDEHLTKPVDPTAILARIDAATAPRPQR